MPKLTITSQSQFHQNQKLKLLKSFIFKEIDSLSQKYNPYVKNAYMYTIQYVVNFAYILIGAIFPETRFRQKN